MYFIYAVMQKFQHYIRLYNILEDTLCMYFIYAVMQKFQHFIQQNIIEDTLCMYFISVYFVVSCHVDLKATLAESRILLMEHKYPPPLFLFLFIFCFMLILV